MHKPLLMLALLAPLALAPLAGFASPAGSENDHACVVAPSHVKWTGEEGAGARAPGTGPAIRGLEAEDDCGVVNTSGPHIVMPGDGESD